MSRIPLKIARQSSKKTYGSALTPGDAERVLAERITKHRGSNEGTANKLSVMLAGSIANGLHKLGLGIVIIGD